MNEILENKTAVDEALGLGPVDEENEKKPPWKLILIGVVAGLSIVGVILILLIVKVEAEKKAAVLVAFVAPIIATLIAMQVQEVHKTVNSRLGEWRRENALTTAKLFELNDRLVQAETDKAAIISAAAVADALKTPPPTGG